MPVGSEERQGPTGRLGPVREGPNSEFWPRAVGVLSVGFCFFPAVESEKGSEDECRVEGPEARVSGEGGPSALWVLSSCSLLSNPLCVPSRHGPQPVCQALPGCSNEVWSR